MMQLKPQDLNFSRTLFAHLAKLHHTNDAGVNRLGYSKETQEAILYLCRLAQQNFGALSFRDLAGTCYIVLEPKDHTDRDMAALAMGSHIDAVPQGGQYDGMAGIIAGLQAMEIAIRSNLPIRAPIVTIMFPNEESSRFQFAVSAKASTGRLHPNALYTADLLGSGETLASAMKTHHDIDIDGLGNALSAAQSLMPDEEIASFIEPHIEQSDVLASMGQDIGIVTNIKGTQRCGYVRFVGEADHSGACPQAERRDAVLGGAHFMVALESALEYRRKTSPDLTFSFGDTRVQGGGSMNIISPNNEILFDIRCSDRQTLTNAMENVRKIGTFIARQRNLVFHIEENSVILQPPVDMDKNLIEGLLKTTDEIRLKRMTLPSGPGHDSQILQQSGRASGVLFIPHTGRSHKKAERMTIKPNDDPFSINGGYASAVRVLLKYMEGKVIQPKRCSLSQPSRINHSPFVQRLIARGAVPVFN